MKTKYKQLEEIMAEIRNSDIETLLKFDGDGKYKFLKCETCDRPILGHQETGCRSLNGTRYDGRIVKSFENWLDRIPLLRNAVNDRQTRMKEAQATEMGQTIRAIVEGMGPGIPNPNPNPATQLVKSRWPPV